MGLLFLVEATAPPGRLPADFSAIGLPLIAIGGMAVARRVVATAKERLIHPRTGYVAYRRVAPRRRWAAVVVAAGVAALVVVPYATMPATQAWIPALDGLVVGALVLCLGHRLGVTRFYALAVVSVVAGLAALASAPGPIGGSAAYFGTMGLAFLASGALALRDYIRHNQPSEEV